MSISEKPLWYLLDSSKLNDYLDCPRMFFYRHIVGWVPDIISHHLVFGEGFHCIMEEILNKGYNEKAVVDGYERFIQVWRRSFTEAENAGKEPKTPPYALKAAVEYIVRYADDESRYETLMTEISGSAPLTVNNQNEWWNRVHFRLDAILRHKMNGFYIVREHKTATANTRSYVNQWKLGIQPGTYTHALYCMYPADEVWGVEINANFFKKSGFEFLRIPVRKTQALMQVWYNIVTREIQNYRRDLDMLAVETENSETMKSFGLRPNSCTKYYGCAYMDFCTAWPNPLARIGELPQGFRIEFWDPRSYEQTRKVEL